MLCCLLNRAHASLLHKIYLFFIFGVVIVCVCVCVRVRARARSVRGRTCFSGFVCVYMYI